MRIDAVHALDRFWRDVLLLLERGPAGSRLHDVATLTYTIKNESMVMVAGKSLMNTIKNESLVMIIVETVGWLQAARCCNTQIHL